MKAPISIESAMKMNAVAAAFARRIGRLTGVELRCLLGCNHVIDALPSIRL